ncbi:hypothetical protein MNV84_00631 [Leishmania braziliensis]|nr:hypothetical protein MNV84_00631 [Leishmania braziliensis]
MSVSLERRQIYELGEVHPRSYGLKATEISSTMKLDLSHNHLRTLQRPFARSSLGGARVAADAGAAVSSPSTATSVSASPMSLEEESSALRPFTSLAHLLVNHNQLRSLVGLCGVADTLTVLIATHNALTSLDGMQACRRLMYVDLSYNSIESLQGLPLILAAPSQRDASPSSVNAHDVQHRVVSVESMPALSHRGTSAVEGAAAAAQLFADVAALNDDEEITLERVDSSDNEGHAPISVSFLTSLEAETHRHSNVPSSAGHPHHHYHTRHSHQQQPPLSWSPGGIGSNRSGVVLILSHNRLRGRALPDILWVELAGAEMGTALGATPLSAHVLLRPWCTALTHLDLSHNYIEDVRYVRRLFTPIRWPSSAASATCAPALTRLRRLDISGNPLLVNGSLAEELTRSVQSPPPATTASPWALLVSSPANARRPTIAPANDRQNNAERAPQASVEAIVADGYKSVLPPVHFRLNYASRTLDAALRAPSPSASAVAFPSLAAAQGAMNALLTSLAERWQCAAPSSSAPATETMFSLFSPSDTCTMEKASQPCAVHLRGGELTVLAAALQQRGARLGEMLEVPAPALCAKRAAESSTPHRACSGRSPSSSGHARNGGAAHTDTAMAAGADASHAIFLTPPPRWSRGTSVNVDTSVLSGRGGPSLTAAQRPTALTTLNFAPPTSPRAALVEAAQDEENMPDDAVSTITTNSSSHVETSTVGYRLYQGRGHQRQPGPVAVKSAERSGNAVAYRDATIDSGAAAVSCTSMLSCSADAVALQLLRAEVVELRRRYRELQRQTRDQTCVLQRQEATIRELKVRAAVAQREHQESKAGLSKAHLEIRRLREQVQALRTSATQTAPPPSTSVSLQLPPSDCA